MIVAEASYEVSDPTVDSQIVQLKSSGANVFFNFTTPNSRRRAHPRGLRQSAGSRCTTEHVSTRSARC